ncbi:methyltransferase [Hirsutella rhossiliensis]|uniref:Methyltransferase domain-containing protein n=1 Tax=Hirsutella rhossiliensis TaxID=111463 RepID=A0A9P8N6H2_9HYPO|nr:methyltransferase domain-containing protein [Hirsutella rhossiliensis]KAH0966674.1 methyltransferase domain-containing protein [Hirsutella rhossiliensis]
MSVFGRATFSAAGYAAARPSYPASLFKTVLAHHNDGPKGFLLDLGCGHGLVAREMSPRFDRVMGVDMSAGMIKQASSMTDDANTTFRQGGAEDLSFVPDGSVDMAVAGQSAHWFDYARAWPELARVVRPGGSLAFWGYKDNVLVGHPRANQVLDQFCYADDEGMKRYWEQPGRERVRNLLRDVEPPAAEWQDVKRILYDVQGDVAEVPDDAEGAWMRKRISLGELEAYLRTFSACQGWRDAHAQARSRAEGGEGDLADMMMDRVVASEPEWKAMGERWRDAEVETVWGTYILLAKRRI